MRAPRARRQPDNPSDNRHMIIAVGRAWARPSLRRTRSVGVTESLRRRVAHSGPPPCPAWRMLD